MLSRFTFISVLFFSSANLIGQKDTIDNCYEIRYLDFFGLDQIKVEKWSYEDREDLIELSLSVFENDSSIQNNFISPLLIWQMKGMHPSCNNEIDTVYLNWLISAYCQIRRINTSELKRKSISGQIDVLRDDFYRQVNNEEVLPKLLFTFDDGPFYGNDIVHVGELIERVDTPFGMIQLSKYQEMFIVSGIDREGRVIWRKSITGLQNRYLKEVFFTDFPISKNSLTYNIKFGAEGEALTLYLKHSGDFLFYFHSW